MDKEKSKEIKRNRKFLKVKTTTNYDKLRLFKGYKSEDFRRFPKISGLPPPAPYLLYTIYAEI